VVLVFRDVSERRRADVALREAHTQLARDELAQHLLADASRVLAASPDYQVRLAQVAQVAVPRLADWCAVSVVDLETGDIRPATVAHVDPARVALADELQRRFPPDPDARQGVSNVIRTGQAELYAEITDDMLAAGARDDEHLRILRDLSFRSAMIVPLVARGQTLGAMTFVWAESNRQYAPADLRLAEELAQRAALALDNARLYDAAQRLNRELEQRVAERTEQIRQNERLLADAQHLARLGSWQWDVATNRVTWSDELYRIYGLQPDSFSATFEGYLAYVYPEDQSIARTAIERALRSHQPFTFEERIVRPDGSQRSLYSQGHVVLDEAGQPAQLVGICQDVTERKQFEENLRASGEQLRQLSSRLQAAREEERTRIARELHDELGGAMTGLKMELARLRRVAPQPEPAAFTELAESMAALIDTTVQTVRRIATDLRPGLLDDLGLVAALEWQLSEFQKRTGIECRLDTLVESVDLHPDSATGLFRVFQETLTNVARHAQAARVDVSLEETDDHLLLQVRDNGRGIAELELLGAKSLGLLGMRERVRSLAGDLLIHGLPGQGTTVRVKIPLRPEATPPPASS
jgi:PAS domain S-box-containing protein